MSISEGYGAFNVMLMHFDGVNHWTMSFSTKSGEKFIYCLYSLGTNLKDLKNNVKSHL